MTSEWGFTESQMLKKEVDEAGDGKEFRQDCDWKEMNPTLSLIQGQ